jgi:hypothetical protein
VRTCTSISFYNTTQTEVAKRLSALGEKRLFISPSINDWVTVYPAACCHQPTSFSEAQRIAASVCPSCNCSAFAVPGHAAYTELWPFSRRGILETIDLQLPKEESQIDTNIAALGRLLDVIGMDARPLDLKESATHLFRRGRIQFSAVFSLLKLVNVVNDYELLLRDRFLLSDDDVVGWSSFLYVE